MTTCPACASPAPEGAASCPLCGFNLAFAASPGPRPAAVGGPGRPTAPRAPRPPTQLASEAATVSAAPGSSVGSSVARTSVLTGNADPAADPYVGRTIAGKYEVLELIGQGGMGKVYKGRHVTLDKIICIKTLRPALLEDPTIVGRFEREAKSASRLNHANSIQVLDFGQDEFGALYIAMEFVSGKDLRKTLRDEFPLGEERICHIVAQVLSALAEAHVQHVIHRDLKPENIMLEQRRGEPDFVKVLDFGIAKIQEPDVPGLTRADVVCGTPLYMSPEQATGAAFDARADLYSVGVILYQLSTGTLPFQGANSMEILTKHVTELPVPPRTRRPEVNISAGMEALILRAMDKDPVNRPASAEEFRGELLKIGEQARRAREEAEVAAKGAIAAHKAEQDKALREKQAAQIAQHTAQSIPQSQTEIVRPSRSAIPLVIAATVGVSVITGGAVVGFHLWKTAHHPSPSLSHPGSPRPTTSPPVAAHTPSTTPRITATPPPAIAQHAPLKVVSTAAHSDARTSATEKKPAHLPPLRHGDAAKAKNLVDEADLEFEEGNLRHAAIVYKQAIEADPSASRAYYGLFRTGLTLKDTAFIREGGEGYLRADPHAPEAAGVRSTLKRY